MISDELGIDVKYIPNKDAFAKSFLNNKAPENSDVESVWRMITNKIGIGRDSKYNRSDFSEKFFNVGDKRNEITKFLGGESPPMSNDDKNEMKERFGLIK